MIFRPLKGNGQFCDFIDQCAINNGGCDENVSCENTTLNSTLNSTLKFYSATSGIRLKFHQFGPNCLAQRKPENHFCV